MWGLLVFLFLVADVASLFYGHEIMGAFGWDGWRWWYTLLWALGMMFVGVWTIRIGGAWATFQTVRTAQMGRVPDREIVDGLFYLVAGALFLTPGFLSDAVAVLLVFPVTRIPLRSLFLWRARRRARAVVVETPQRPPPGAPEVVDVDFKVER